MRVTAAVGIVCALIGLYVGLYLNLVIDRVPRKKAMRPVRAGCRNCLDAEGSAPVVPRLPWVLRGGHCPVCGERVSLRYPLVELSTAVLYAAIAVRLGANWALPAFLVFFACLVAISVIDLELQIIPNRVIYPTIVLSLPLLALAAVAEGDIRRMATALAGAAIAFGILLLVHLISPASMGFGDVRLAFILGLFLGWFDLSHVAIGLFVGFALGAVVGVGLMLLGGKTRKDSVSFGPFLAAGAAVAVLFGDPLLHWWLRT
ncbi:MAG: A24 family peptidase [Actinomycetota bacterium]|nr:A24 family peptidase [Actinomycetota bacterium]